MRIVSLVHNDVLKDARVIKEAMTLRRAGHQVEIHGITKCNKPERHILPGSDVEVFLHPRWTASPGLHHVAKVLQAVICVAVAAGLVFESLAVTQQPLLVALGWAAIAVAAFVWRRNLLSGANYVAARLWRAVGGPAQRVLDAMGLLTPVRYWRSARVARALLNGISARPRPDAIHIHDVIALIAAPDLKSRFDVPLVWDAHEIYEDLAGGSPSVSARNARIIRDNAEFIDGFVTINDSIAAFYREQHPVLPQAIVVMNATFASQAPAYDGRLHRAANLPLSQRILLFQGGFGPKRGLHDLVRAASRFRSEWTLVMMGWGNLEDELRRLAAANERPGGPPAVVFLPSVPQIELQAWSAGAALGAIPYENTGLNHRYCTPNKLWEYPNAGVPILCTALDEMTAFVQEHGIGFLLPANCNDEDIFQAVNSITDEELAKAKRNCPTCVAASNWEAFAPRLVALYAALPEKSARLLGGVSRHVAA